MVFFPLVQGAVLPAFEARAWENAYIDSVSYPACNAAKGGRARAGQALYVT